VRAIAVLAVMGFHEGARALTGGFLGVDVFFVLSGFLITDLLATRPRDLRQFWLRRARRLLPALAVMLVVVTAAATIIEPSAGSALRLALAAAATYTSNWYQLLHHVPYFDGFGPPSPLQHLWSLAIEEQFYLIWPLILGLLILRHNGRRARIAAPLIGAAGSALAMALLYTPRNPSGVYYRTDTHASALLIGAALALACPLAKLTTTTGAATRRLDVAGVAGLAVFAWAVGHFSGGDAAVYPAGLLLAALASAGVIAAAAGRGAVAAITSLPPLRWIGVRSYAMYLWHWPVIALTAVLAGRAAKSPVACAAETTVTIALAAASWRFVESPVLRNGFLVMSRGWYRQLASACTRPTAGPRRAIPIAASAAVVAVVAVAGFGVAAPGRGPADAGLLRQVAEGERVSAASLRQKPPPPAPPVIPAPSRRPPYAVPRPARAWACRVNGWQVTAIGDSVMLASAYALEAQIPGLYLDAKVGRQVRTGVQIVGKLAASGRLRRFVVIGLGTNGDLTAGDIRQLRLAAGPSRELILVNVFGPMSWVSQVNNVLARSAWHKPHVMVANWAAAIASHPDLLWTDGIHPRPSGASLYARTVKHALASLCG